MSIDHRQEQPTEALTSMDLAIAAPHFVALRRQAIQTGFLEKTDENALKKIVQETMGGILEFWGALLRTEEEYQPQEKTEIASALHHRFEVLRQARELNPSIVDAIANPVFKKLDWVEFYPHQEDPELSPKKPVWHIQIMGQMIAHYRNYPVFGAAMNLATGPLCDGFDIQPSVHGFLMTHHRAITRSNWNPPNIITLNNRFVITKDSDPSNRHGVFDHPQGIVVQNQHQFWLIKGPHEKELLFERPTIQNSEAWSTPYGLMVRRAERLFLDGKHEVVCVPPDLEAAKNYPCFAGVKNLQLKCHGPIRHPNGFMTGACFTYEKGDGRTPGEKWGKALLFYQQKPIEDAFEPVPLAAQKESSGMLEGAFGLGWIRSAFYRGYQSDESERPLPKMIGTSTGCAKKTGNTVHLLSAESVHSHQLIQGVQSLMPYPGGGILIGSKGVCLNGKLVFPGSFADLKPHGYGVMILAKRGGPWRLYTTAEDQQRYLENQEHLQAA